MRKTREEKAITLIALIITIVVLLILAVVAINAVTGDGIIQHATNAKTEYEKAQDKEDDMLAYYEGVLQSGEVVPTVEQLQEKYEFIYFSSLKRAIENANGDETKTADVTKENVENAVAGVYGDSENNKCVVLMKDTQLNESIFVTEDMTINLGGKTLKFTTPEASFYFGKASASDTETTKNEVTIDGRIGGSAIEKDIADATEYNETIGIIVANGKSLKINSGKYSVTGVNSDKIYLMKIYEQNEKFEMNNAKITASNNATSSTYCRGMLVKSGEAIVNNCGFDINTSIGEAIAIYNTSTNFSISNSKMDVNSNNGKTIGILNKDGIVVVNNTNIYTDANNNIGAVEGEKFSAGIANNSGTLKFYSGYSEGTRGGILSEQGGENYIYGGTFYGKGSYAMWLQGDMNGTIKLYAENANIITGEYKGEYNFADFTGTKGNAILVSNSVDLYMDNCNIVGNNQINENSKAIETIDTQAANINISNSRITGALDIIANKTLNIGAGMNRSALTITGAGTVNETGISYKGMDKTLMAGN